MNWVPDQWVRPLTAESRSEVVSGCAPQGDERGRIIMIYGFGEEAPRHPVRAGEVNGLSAVAAGLGGLTEVGVEVRVADDLVVAHPLASGVDDVDELGGKAIQ